MRLRIDRIALIVGLCAAEEYIERLEAQISFI
jgi:hypothetical protein